MGTSVNGRTPLYAEHLAAGGKMVEFAGFEMPIYYQAEIMREHVHTRVSAGLADHGFCCLALPRIRPQNGS